MSLIKGGFQRLFQTFLYFLLFLCSGIILGIYSYFLSVLADRNIHIPQWEKAVEGISGVAVVYTICATILTCCLGGVSFFAFLALVLDVLFAAGMIAIAVMTRDGADSCKGIVQTPIGTGPANQDNGYGNNGIGTGNGENLTYSVHLGLACRLNTAAFAISIIAALLFICTAVMQIMLVRHHKKEKRYGPSPSNNYTSGYGKKFGFGRKKKTVDNTNGTYTGTSNGAYNATHKDAEAGYIPPTGTATTAPAHTHGHQGYYTQPTGTAASNPYGYSNQATNY